jgi:hypothetical protein
MCKASPSRLAPRMAPNPAILILLSRRSGQKVRGHPASSGPERERCPRWSRLCRGASWVEVSVAVSPAHDCFVPKHGMCTVEVKR